MTSLYTRIMRHEEKNDNDDKKRLHKKDEWGFNYWETVTQAELEAWRAEAKAFKKFKGVGE